MSLCLQQAQRQVRRSLVGGNWKWIQVEHQRLLSTQNADLVTEVLTEGDWQIILGKSKEEKKGLLVQFTAVWCPPCRMIAPVVSQLAKENAERVRFVKIDIDKKDVASIVLNHNVSSVPTFVGYSKTGSLMESFSGADKEKLERTVREIAE